MMFNGVPIFESPLAQRLAGGKIHVWKKWMNRRCYHNRIEKKWARRYGPVKLEPQMYMAKNPLGGGDVLIVHPSLMPRIRAAIQKAAPDYSYRLFNSSMGG